MIGEIISAKVARVVRENILVCSIYLEPEIRIPRPKPGQFLMIWVPEYEEVPMSISGYYGDIVRITVAAVGPTTKRLNKTQVGEYLGIKGPLGNGLELKGIRYLLVGGGYGVAPLIYAMQEIKRVGGKSTIIIGARTKEQLLMVGEAEKYGEVFVCTDDGSYGYKGTAYDFLIDIVDDLEYDEVLVCGPKILLLKVAKYCVEKNIKCWVFAEEYMKCGIGLCGSCVLGTSSILVCREGPVINAETFISAVGMHI